MQITDVHVILTCPGRNYVFVKILTDEPGLYGIGEGTLNGSETIVAEADGGGLQGGGGPGRAVGGRGRDWEAAAGLARHAVDQYLRADTLPAQRAEAVRAPARQAGHGDRAVPRRPRAAQPDRGGAA